MLAAAGWEHEPKRRRILRELLSEHLKTIYLHHYAVSRNRAAAMDSTRRVLMRVARTLGDVPDGCPLAVWVFLAMVAERGKGPEYPDLWRILSLINSGDGTEASDSEVNGHPLLRPLVSRFREFRQAPEDPELETRAGWTAAAGDLACFLQAQFGEEPCEPSRLGSFWSRSIGGRFWKTSARLAAAVTIVGALLVALVLRSWIVGHLTGTKSAPPARAVNQAGALNGGSSKEPERIEGAQWDFDGHTLSFHWDPSKTSEEYRLYVLTAKLDTLRTVQGLTRPGFNLSINDVPGLRAPGSYLFKVDGHQGGALTASSGIRVLELH